jgi:hypothetical protein
MTQVRDEFWQAETRTEETRQFIKDIKRLTCRKCSTEQKIRRRPGGLPPGHSDPGPLPARRDSSGQLLCLAQGLQEGCEERLTRDTVGDVSRREVPRECDGKAETISLVEAF